MRLDADEESHARSLFARARERFATRNSPFAFVPTLKRLAERTEAWQQTQWENQVRAALGADLSHLTPNNLKILDQWIRENISLIRSISDKHFDDVKNQVLAAIANKQTPAALAQRLAERYGITLDRARIIARDQIGKLNGELMAAAQVASGVESYLWHGELDDRERDHHVEREGRKFNWNDPPEDGHPGMPVQCRCWAEPVFS